MAAVYLETTFVSALVTDRTDVASLYRREVSRMWWSTQRRRHRVVVSEEVIAELSDPSYPRSALALAEVQNVPRLVVTESVLGLAAILVREKVMPRPIAGDALHVAAAALYGVDFVLTWNVRHLANANKLHHLHVVCTRAGVLAPRLVTPELLWEWQDE